uniref:Uncharacterized protein n=1 Tax=Virgibacillus oceani TaxID=1479511 RepID=A0A917M4P4_9BACI|nr:hypothetical protein GCM10011398_24880 [Virgibacillus oceani]
MCGKVVCFAFLYFCLFTLPFVYTSKVCLYVEGFNKEKKNERSTQSENSLGLGNIKILNGKSLLRI